MDNFEHLEGELAPATQILSGDNEKNPSFSHTMSKVIAKSQTQTRPNGHSSSKMIKEVLNYFLHCQMVSQCLGFWKNYEKNPNTKIKLSLTKVAKNLQYPQMLKDCFLQLDIFSQTKETDSFLKIWKSFFYCQEDLPVVGFLYLLFFINLMFCLN